MTLYLDTEFNGHGGELISIAIVSSKGGEFYGERHLSASIHPWVAEHVVPHLHGTPDDDDVLRLRLKHFLEAHPSEGIVADWPDDFALLMRLMSGPDYSQSWMVPLAMLLLVSGEIKPEVPHNALSDARALMAWHLALPPSNGDCEIEGIS